MIKNKTSSSKLFSTPCSAEYWRLAFQEVRSIRSLTVAALFVAIHIVVSAFFIPVGESLRIYFSFFVISLGSMIYGPVMGLLTGFVSDILGFIIHPSGGFFFGYILTAMLSAFFYAIALYRTKITVAKIFTCKLLVNVLINIGLGSLWSSILYGKGFYYYLAKSVVKNLLLLPVEVFLLVVFLQIMCPVTARLGLTPKQPDKRFPWF